MAFGAEERARMDAAVAEVRRLHAAAKAKAQAVRAQDARVLSLVTATERQVAKAIEDEAPRVQRWETTMRRWAEAGRRDGEAPGSYSVARWLELGQDLAGALTLYTRESWNASLFSVVENTARATVDDARAGLNPLNWPTWAKALAALLGVGAALVVVSKVSGAAKLLTGGGA